MRPFSEHAFAGTILASLLIPVSIFAAPPDRLTGVIENSRSMVQRGSVNPLARAEYDRGTLDAGTRISGASIDLQPTAEQQAALETFLEEQRDPSSPQYQHWLTPEEFGDGFGLSPNDVAQIVAWLEAQGLTVEYVGTGRNWILFGGTAGQIGRVFQTTLRHYEVNGEMHFANDTAPSVPGALGGVVRSIRGLDDFKPKPSRTAARKVVPMMNRAGYHFLVPDDIAAIYDITPLYQAGYSGTGQKLAIAGQTDINMNDILAFRGYFGLSATTPQVVLVGADPGTSSDDEVEADIDVEWSGAVARDATILYVNSTNVFTSLQYAINQNLAPVISVSYGSCELGSPVSFRNVAQQASAQGITWMNASGDQGAAGCDYGASVAQYGPAVTFPADIPEVVAVGGTEFNESGNTGWSSTNSATYSSALGYLPEKGWNDTAAGDGIQASGGGASVLFTKPWWQTGPGVPADNARDVPDVALAASAQHDAYLVTTSDTLMSVGGTSVASPVFAGLVSVLNQYLVAKGTIARAGLGNVLPTLYALAQQSTTVFHDITTGNNIVPCKSGSRGCSSGSFGYSAGPGYDMVTGLGSVDAYNLVTQWTSVAPGAGTTTTLMANPASVGTSGSTQLTATIAPVSGTNVPTGSVAFTTAAGATLGSAAVTAGTAPNGTATLAVKASSLASGANTITATYTASGSFRNSSGTAVVTVTVPGVNTTTTVTANPASMAYNASTVLTVTVKPASGSTAPAGSVAFTAGNTALGTATLAASGASGTATLAVKASALATGANAITAAYTASGGFNNSSGTASVTVAPPPAATTTALTASPASLASSGSAVLTATVTPASGTTVPGGPVTFATAAKTLGTATLSAGKATLTVLATALATGSNSITATYGGATNFAGSASPAVTVTVAPPAAMTTTAAANPTSIAESASTQVTVTVTAASGNAAASGTVPGGSVSLALGSKALGTATLTAGTSSATATFTVQGASLAAGSNTLTATYAGTTAFAASKGTVAVTMVPPPAVTTTKLMATPASIAQSASTVLTASVTASAGTPTGTVAFTAGSTKLGTAALSAGKAALTVQAGALATGSNAITATYTPQGNFQGSTGNATVTVQPPPAATTLTLTSSAASVAQTATFELTATVKGSSGSGIPTGTVTFTDGNTTLGTGTLVAQSAAGDATATINVKASSLPAGQQTVKASYAGSGSFLPATGTATVTIAGAATATGH